MKENVEGGVAISGISRRAFDELVGMFSRNSFLHTVFLYTHVLFPNGAISICFKDSTKISG